MPSACILSTSANRGSSEGILSSTTNKRCRFVPKPAQRHTKSQLCVKRKHQKWPNANVAAQANRWTGRTFLCARSLADCEPLQRFSCCARAVSRAGPGARCRWKHRRHAWQLRRPHRGLKRQRRPEMGDLPPMDGHGGTMFITQVSFRPRPYVMPQAAAGSTAGGVAGDYRAPARWNVKIDGINSRYPWLGFKLSAVKIVLAETYGRRALIQRLRGPNLCSPRPKP